MPLPVLAAVVVYCTTFVACCILFHIWGLKHVSDAAAVLALVPAILAYAWMMN